MLKGLRRAVRWIAGLPKEIEITWTYPILVTTALSDYDLSGTGLYQITSKTPKKDDYLYIGKTHSGYKKRILSHQKQWFENYKGEKYIRFGTVTTPISTKELREIEGVIIAKTQPKYNTINKKTYIISRHYDIYSAEFRGNVPSLIATEDN